MIRLIRSILVTITLLCGPVTALLAAGNAPPDPTRPPDSAEIRAFFDGGEITTEIAFQLQSVLISNQRRIAIINGQRVSEGDRIGTAEVSHIEAGRVVMLRDGQSFVLTISSRRPSVDGQRQAEALHVQ